MTSAMTISMRSIVREHGHDTGTAHTPWGQATISARAIVALPVMQHEARDSAARISLRSLLVEVSRLHPAYRYPGGGPESRGPEYPGPEFPTPPAPRFG